MEKNHIEILKAQLELLKEERMEVQQLMQHDLTEEDYELLKERLEALKSLQQVITHNIKIEEEDHE